MNYSQAIKYLNSFQNLEKKPFFDYKKSFRLKRFYKLCDIIGHPQDSFKSILIAGTKGKGSTCAMLHSILTEAGYKTGLYTSPHLIDVRERIKLNKTAVSKKEFSWLMSEIKDAITYANPEYALYYKDITFFEILTAAAFLYFSKKKIDFAVLEVGLGGRLDATNVACPLVSGITSISYDHTDFLGTTLRSIAKEKSGIIKENSFVVSAPQDSPAGNVIENISCRQNSKLFIIGKDIKYKCASVNFHGTTFDYEGSYANYKNIKIPLTGAHQAQNAAVALAIVEVLKDYYYYPISKKNIIKGLKKTKWPGRFQMLHKNPYIIVDGAHNKSSAEALKRAIRDVNGKEKIDTLIFGCSVDKDITGTGSALCAMAKNVIFTKSSSPRAADPATLLKLLSGHCCNSVIADTSKKALILAKKLTPHNGIMLIAGSLFLAGDMIKIQKHVK
ncbi:MAG: bifunctional folylpolyglutamate synthase/dihydrofolate synthase [Candidatus Omnitrophica bacterium]|nr:bifunctional folylpolyglutamate synthase/dihydrofolate synthase [Candidatus Omnitrophota bacterium]